MQVEFSVELGADDPVLEMPWSHGGRCLQFYDLRRHPELVLQIPEAAANPPLEKFLLEVNSRSIFYTAKCDVWISRLKWKDANEEEKYGKWRCGSYVDLVLANPKEGFSDLRRAFTEHAELVEKIMDEVADWTLFSAAVQFALRWCRFHRESGDELGFFVTVYIFGLGQTKAGARRVWVEALKAVGCALTA